MTGREGTSLGLPGAHCQLTIRIERRGERGNLHVICLEPEFLSVPVQWEDSASRCMSRAINPAKDMSVRDARADFEVKTGEIEVKENCQPLA